MCYSQENNLDPLLHTQGNLQAHDIQSNTRKIKFGPNQYFYGDNSSALYWRSYHSTMSQIILRDKENKIYGRLTGSGDSDYFGLIDADGYWSYLAAKDNYTDFRINNISKLRMLENGNVGIGTITPAGKLSVISSDNEKGIESYNPNGNSHFPDASGWSILSGKGVTFRTNNNTERMRIASNGNVGIGDTNPQKKLVVRGNAELGGINSDKSLGIQYYSSALPGVPGSTFGVQLTGPLYSHLVFDVRANDNSDGFHIRVPTTPSNTNYVADKIAFAVKASGRVGIGLEAPSGKLTVKSSVGEAGIESLNPNGNSFFPYGNGWSYLSGEGIIFRTSGETERMRIKANGNVGIGTDNPTNKLAVVGGVNITGRTVIGNVSPTDDSNNNIWSYKLFVEKGILTEKVRVAVKNTSNWADYVFAEDYTLMPLNKLEDYISKNKHLPNVPSAEEVVEKGLDVATMDAKLLEKIEEAYLYIMDLQKQIDTLKSTIHDQH